MQRTLVFLLVASLAFSRIDISHGDDFTVDENRTVILQTKPIKLNLKIDVFSCGQYSVWKFSNVGIFGNTFYYRFQSSMVNQQCQHRLVIKSPCNIYTVTYITTNVQGPALIYFKQILAGWGAPTNCPNNFVHIAESAYISPIYGQDKLLQYEFSGLERNQVRIKGKNGEWGPWAQFHQGQKSVWFQ